MLQLALQEAAASCSDVVCLCSAGVSMVSELRGVVMSVWGVPAAAASSAARSVCLCSAVILEVNGLRVEVMFV